MRRRRFTVRLRGVRTPQVVLAYNREDARRHYERGGHEVLSVIVGDYRVLARNEARAQGGGWRVIPVQLRKAIETYGLRYPVVVKQTGHRGGRYGAYSLRTRNGRPYHHITIKSWLTPEQSNRTLWHELTHARQAERAAVGDLDPLTAWANDPARRGPYMRRPTEVEARQWEARMAPVRKLTTKA